MAHSREMWRQAIAAIEFVLLALILLLNAATNSVRSQSGCCCCCYFCRCHQLSSVAKLASGAQFFFSRSLAGWWWEIIISSVSFLLSLQRALARTPWSLQPITTARWLANSNWPSLIEASRRSRTLAGKICLLDGRICLPAIFFMPNNTTRWERKCNNDYNITKLTNTHRENWKENFWRKINLVHSKVYIFSRSSSSRSLFLSIFLLAAANQIDQKQFQLFVCFHRFLLSWYTQTHFNREIRCAHHTDICAGLYTCRVSAG